MDVSYVDPKLMDSTLLMHKQCSQIDIQLQVKSYGDAVIYPAVPGLGGGVVDGDGTYVDNSSIYSGAESQEGAYIESCEIEYCDEDVVYIGMFYSCWGHCITDCLQKLWFLNSNQCSAEIKRLKFVYSFTAWGAELVENFQHILAILGFQVDQLVGISAPVRYRRVYVPDSCFLHGVNDHPLSYTKEFSDMIANIIHSVVGMENQVPYRSVYLTRSHVRDRRNFADGEYVVEKVFRRMGFEIVRPELLSLEQMIALLAQTKVLASTDGSCAHNAIFLPNDATCVVVRKAAYVNAYQALIGEMRRLKTIYIDSNRSIHLFYSWLPMLGPFFLYVNRRLAAFSGAHAYFPVFTYAKYCIYVLWFRRHNLRNYSLRKAFLKIRRLIACAW